MYIAEKIAAEIYQAYCSGKCGIVLEMEHKQEWEPICEILCTKYLKGKMSVKIRTTGKIVGDKIEFAPVLYQRLHTPYSLEGENDFDMKAVSLDSYVAVALEKSAERKDVGLFLIENYHLLDAENKRNSVIELIYLLTTEINQKRPLILLTVDHLENLPSALHPYVYTIHSQKPDILEIQEKVEQLLQKRKLQVEDSLKQEIVSYLQGFHCYEMEYLFEKAELLYGKDAFQEKKILELIGSEKVKLLEKDRLLEWKMVKEDDIVMANMEVLSTYIQESGKIMGNLENAVNNGVDVPKGILIMGLPGTGKSLFAKYAAAMLKVPLIRLEMGKMMGGHVGDSERNLRNAQKQAEEMAPCILWIDEIEKGFAGSGRQKREEGAYLQRMTGSFLTWLQEKKSSCYIIATANSIEGLPPEFFRNTRFDKCFFTFMPSERELRNIFQKHLLKPARVHVKPVMDQAIDEIIYRAAKARRFFTGADASALVSNTFRRLYLDYISQTKETDKKEYDRNHLTEVMKKEFEKIRVFSETNQKDIADYYIAAKNTNFVNASKKNQAKNTQYENRLESFITEEIDCRTKGDGK